MWCLYIVGIVRNKNCRIVKNRKHKYRSKSIRLQNYDYRTSGYYFVTICTQHRIPHFGKIINQKINHTEIGKVARKYFEEIPVHFPGSEVDIFTIMPNHVHGIILIEENSEIKSQKFNKFSCNLSGSLSAIIQQYKAAVTRWCRKSGFAEFSWQPRFYEHIIRNEKSLMRIQNYIKYNHLKWEYDGENLNQMPTSEKKKFWKDFLI